MPSKKKSKKDLPASAWTFLTNHSHVLLCLAEDDMLRVRDIADKVGITERAVLKILSELESGGVLERKRDGRRNRYRILHRVPLRHAIEKHRTVGDLVTAVHGR